MVSPAPRTTRTPLDPFGREEETSATDLHRKIQKKSPLRRYALIAIALLVAGGLYVFWGKAENKPSVASGEDATAKADARTAHKDGSPRGPESDAAAAPAPDTTIATTIATIDAAAAKRDARPTASKNHAPDASTQIKVRPKKPHNPPPRPRHFGSLTLNTFPWSIIYYRGKKLGPTPLVNAKLPVGRVRLLAVNKEEGIRKKLTLTIRRGQHLRKIIKLGAK
jgi:hypothetical protein